MKRTLRWVIGPALVLTTVSCAAQTSGAGAPAAPAASPPAGAGAPAAAAPAPSGAPVSIYTGVYTAEQADRGDATQRRECAACHSPTDWAAGRVLSGFTGQTAYDLVSHLRNTMPMDSPGRLSLQQYTDIVTFMFELNNVPAGDTELAATDEALRAVQIEYRR